MFFGWAVWKRLPLKTKKRKSKFVREFSEFLKSKQKSEIVCNFQCPSTNMCLCVCVGGILYQIHVIFIMYI